MAKVIVQKIIKEGTTKNGKTFYNVMGTIDGEADVFDMWISPEVGKEYDGEIKESQFGKSFSLPRSGGGGGFKNDPATRKEIIRQSSLKEAINILSAKAQYIEREEALELLTFDKVLKVATMFAEFAEGTRTASGKVAPAKPAEVAHIEQSAPGSQEEDNSSPTKDEYVDPKELPF